MESTHAPAPEYPAPPEVEKDVSSHDSSSIPTPSDAEKDSAYAKQHVDSSLSQDVSRDLSHQLSRIATSDYPTGLRLAMIVVALVLTIFLMAIDMVSLGSAQLKCYASVVWFGFSLILMAN